MPNTITVSLPDDLSAKVHAIAEKNNQSVEEVLLEYVRSFSEPLPKLPPDEQAELDALQHLSDDALWTIARSVMSQEIKARMQILMDKNTHGTISDDEYAELGSFVERGDQLMLRKAEAMAILTRRGYTITKEDLAKRA